MNDESSCYNYHTLYILKQIQILFLKFVVSSEKVAIQGTSREKQQASTDFHRVGPSEYTTAYKVVVDRGELFAKWKSRV